MILVIKFLLFFVLVVSVNVFGINSLAQSGLSTSMVLGIVIEIGVVLFLFVYFMLLRPISKLYSSLKIINFDDDYIDCSKLDVMGITGSSEVRQIIKKFKYLIDIIAERINKINSETYKSEHDGLSGCYNRVHLDAVKSTYESSQQVAILFIDVNNLKRMNDEFGHEAGDNLIVAAAQKLKYWNNMGDVYRMGGDEFMVVILDRDPDDVKRLVDEWYPTVGQLNRSSDGFRCVLSWGLAFGMLGCNFDTLQKQADDEMYKFKVAIKKKFGEPMR